MKLGSYPNDAAVSSERMASTAFSVVATPGEVNIFNICDEAVELNFWNKFDETLWQDDDFEVLARLPLLLFRSSQPLPRLAMVEAERPMKRTS